MHRRLLQRLILAPSASSTVKRYCASSPSTSKQIGALVGDGNLEASLSLLFSTSRLVPVSCSEVSAVLHLCEEKKDLKALHRIVDEMVKPNPHLWANESIMSILLRVQCEANDLGGALRTASFVRQTFGGLKRRTWSPLLRFCCRRLERDTSTGLVAEAVKSNIEMDAKDVEALVVMYREVKEPIQTIHHLLGIAAMHVPTVTPPTAAAITEWVKSSTVPLRVHETAVSSSGVCCQCHTQLQGAPFTVGCQAALLKDLRRVGDNPKTHRGSRAKMEWKSFMKSCSARMKEVDVIVDGANVGYYGLSSWFGVMKERVTAFREENFPEMLAKRREGQPLKSCTFSDVPVNMELIDESVRALKASGRRPMIILHERHLEPYFLIPENQKYVEQWHRDSIPVYATPRGLNDDICWLYAAIQESTPSDALDRGGAAPRRVYVLTNDLMRDHHFRMLSPKAFISWRDRHRIGFKCVRENQCTRICLHEPDVFSRCVQYDASSCGWHLPISEPLSEASEGGEDDDEMQPTADSIDVSNVEKDVKQRELWVCLH